jgi:NSS family neurotransmitter:Na+ symporter
MIELGVRTILDFGGRRRPAVLLVVGAALVLGTPSALSAEVFKNQDWAWGLGLLVTGFLFALGAVVHGTGRLRALANRGQSSWRLGRWFDGAVTGVIPLLFLAMLAWWFRQTWDEATWWNPFRTFSLGTCLGQWGIALLALLLCNRWLARSGR